MRNVEGDSKLRISQTADLKKQSPPLCRGRLCSPLIFTYSDGAASVSDSP
jgi:hypothetical protein